MFRFYKTILDLKTRLQEQNLKKIHIFSLSLNWKKIHVSQNEFALKNEFFTEGIFLNRITFFESEYKYLI